MLSKNNLHHHPAKLQPEKKSNLINAEYIDVDSKMGKELFSAIVLNKPETVQAQLIEKNLRFEQNEMPISRLRDDIVLSPMLAANMLRMSCINIQVARIWADKIDQDIQSSDIYKKWCALDYFRNLDKYAAVFVAHHLDFTEKMNQEAVKTTRELEELGVVDTSADVLQEFKQQLDKQLGSQFDERERLLDKQTKYLIFVRAFLYYCKQREVDLAQANISEYHIETLSHHLISLNDIKITELTLELSIPIEDKCKNKKNALMALMKHDISNEIFELVLKQARIDDMWSEDEKKYNLVEYACYKNDIEKLSIVARAIQELAGNEVIAYMASKALFTAVVLKRDVELIQQLIAYGAALNMKNEVGITAAELAYYSNYHDQADFLMQRGADSTNIIRHRLNLMNQMKEQKKLQLRERAKQVFNDIKAVMHEFKTDITSAKTKCDHLQLKMLTKQSDFNGMAQYREEQKQFRPVLLKAISDGNVQGVIKLVSDGADINYRGEKFATEAEWLAFGVSIVNVAEMPPLFFAALYSDASAMMFQLLLELGVSVVEASAYTRAHYSKDIKEYVSTMVNDSALNVVIEHQDWPALAKTDFQMRMKLTTPPISTVGLGGIVARPAQTFHKVDDPFVMPAKAGIQSGVG